MLKHLSRQFISSTSGNVAMMAALLAVPMFGVAGIALDAYRLGDAKARLQSAIDAGALAGASSTSTRQDDIRKIVLKFAAANGTRDIISDPSGIMIDILRDGTITVRAEGKMNTTLTSLLGYTTMDVVAETTVKSLSGGAEVALVVDTTESMNAGGRIGALRAASRKFVSIIESVNSTRGDHIKVSLVPYAAYVNVGTFNKNASWLGTVDETGGNVWRGCVGPREHPKDTQDNGYGVRIPPMMNIYCANEIEPLTSDAARLNSRIDGLVANGLTYIPGGLMWGWRTLSESAPFAEGATKVKAKEDNIHKVIVLMTDGQNTLEKVPGTPVLKYNGDSHGNYDTAVADARMLEVCENVKDDGVEVYTIGFKLQEPDMKAKLEQCSSSPENYFDASSDAQLSAAFQSIANKVSAIYLSR